MNYQRKPPEAVLNLLKEHGGDTSFIDYYAFPNTFSSTSGPCGGIGGQAMSSFTIEAWACGDSGPTIYVCKGMYCFDPGPFELFKLLNRWKKLPE